jgi:hypothetical protein
MKKLKNDTIITLSIPKNQLIGTFTALSDILVHAMT